VIAVSYQPYELDVHSVHSVRQFILLISQHHSNHVNTQRVSLAIHSLALKLPFTLSVLVGCEKGVV
jgi:hypothetical protein